MALPVLVLAVAAVATGCGSGADKSSEAYGNGYQLGRQFALSSSNGTDLHEGCRTVMETTYLGSTSEDGYRDLVAGCRAGAADLNELFQGARTAVDDEDETRVVKAPAPSIPESSNESVDDLEAEDEPAEPAMTIIPVPDRLQKTYAIADSPAHTSAKIESFTVDPQGNIVSISVTFINERKEVFWDQGLDITVTVGRARYYNVSETRCVDRGENEIFIDSDFADLAKRNTDDPFAPSFRPSEISAVKFNLYNPLGETADEC